MKGQNEVRNGLRSLFKKEALYGTMNKKNGCRDDTKDRHALEES